MTIMTNKKNIYYITGLLSFFIAFASCEDYRMHNMVDDTVYLVKPGLNEAQVFNWGDFDYELPVIKSGIGQQDAVLELVIDETVMADYNAKNSTDYQIFPENCFSITSKDITFDKKGYQQSFHLMLKTHEIAALQKSGNYCIPVRMLIKNNTIEAADSDRVFSLIVPVVQEPYLGFQSSGMLLSAFEISPDMSAETKFSSTVVTNYNNSWELTYKLSVKPELVEAYNQEKGTDFELLPTEAYAFDEASFKLEPSDNEGNFDFTIFIEKLKDQDGKYLFGDYVIPVQIESVSQYGIDPENATVLIPVSFQPTELDRNNWEVIECSSETVNEEEPLKGGKNGILDGDAATYWQSSGEALPQYLVIDMKEEHEVLALKIARQNQNTDTKLVRFETSLDGETFEKVCDIDFGTADQTDAEKEMLISGKKARYIKCIVTESNNAPAASIAEIYIKGM